MKPPIFTRLWGYCLWVLLCVSCQKEIIWSHYVSTYAGGATTGPLEGHTDSVYFGGPNNIAIDRNGNLFVSDRNTHRVRKISPGGMVVTIAGRRQGFADGIGAAARFNTIRGVALDGVGTIYVADRGNHSIRKITPRAEVSTLAGDGTAGFSNGTGESVQFNNPIGVAVDEGGNVYVADSDNSRIRKLTPDGKVNTLAGKRRGFADGVGVDALFRDPVDLALDGRGNVYVADQGNHCIRKITPDGQVTTLAGSGTAGYADGTGKSARFNAPEGVAVDKRGMVYVSDTENNRIRRITPDGVVSTIAGDGQAGFVDGPGHLAQFKRPRGLALDPKGGYLYVADRDNRRIRKIALR